MAVRTCAPFRKGSGAPEHRPTPRHMVRSRIRQVRTGNRKPFLKRFRFRFQVQVQEMDHPVLSCNNRYKNRRSHTAVILALVRWNGTDSGKRCKKVQTKCSKRFQVDQKGADRCKGCTKRFKQVQKDSGSGANHVFQVQVHRRTGRVRGQPWYQLHRCKRTLNSLKGSVKGP